MNIRTLIRIAVATSVFIVLVLGVMNWFFQVKLGQISAMAEQAHSTTYTISNLLMLTHEYALYGEKRPAQQWQTQRSALIRKLQAGSAYPLQTSPDTLSKAEELSGYFRELTSAMQGQTDLHERQANFMTDRLLNSLQIISDRAERWERAAVNQRMILENKFRMVTLATPIFMLMVLFMLSMVLSRRVLYPLKTLHKAVLAVAKGDLTVNCASQTKDELGDFSRTFDAMAVGLVTELRREITERKQAEQSLAESEARFKALHNASCGGIAVHDQGVILECNQGLSEMTGYEYSELIGMNGLLLIAEGSREAVTNNIRTGFEKPYEAFGLRKNGEEFPVQLEARSVPYKGKQVRTVECRDFTERKQAEVERENLQTQLQQAQKMEAIGTLAGGIAHDFNNILGAILGYAEMAQEDSPAGSILRQDIDQIVKAGHRARELVKQILAFSRQAETEQMLLQPALIIQEVIKMLRSSLPSTITIKQNIDMDAGLVMASPTQIHQIVMNLCTNAFHAMEKAGGTLTISLEKKTLNEKDIIGKADVQPGDFVQLLIGDTGTGISPELWDKIFDPYFTTKEVGKGTGMGLAIIHGIVKSYGGCVSFSSHPGKGTDFRILLPVMVDEALVENKPEETVQLGNERILYIDDEELLAELGKSMLERLGYQVTVLSNSLEALTIFQNQPDKFDLVITDQTMPGMTGSDLARRILQIRPFMPIILCTGYSSVITEEKAKSLGIKGFAMKPMARKSIAALIRELLDEGRRLSLKSS